MEAEVVATSHETTLPADELGHQPEVFIDKIHPDLAMRHGCLIASTDEIQYLIGCRAADPQTEIIDFGRLTV